MHSVSVSDANVWPGLLQPRAQPVEVLDDAVVDHGDPAGAIQVRVGVASVGAPWVAHRVWPIPVVPEERVVGQGVVELGRACRHA